MRLRWEGFLAGHIGFLEIGSVIQEALARASKHRGAVAGGRNLSGEVGAGAGVCVSGGLGRGATWWLGGSCGLLGVPLLVFLLLIVLPFLPTGLPKWILIVPLLGFLVFIHELGHFVTAKRFGITVHEFGIGIPPRIFGD